MPTTLAKRAPSAALSTAILLLAGCAASPPAAVPPKLERLTGAQLAARLPAPLAKVGLDEIVALSRDGASAQSITGKIDASHSRYRLDADQIATLLKNGVAPGVIGHMMEAERRRIFDDLAAELAQQDQACLERVEREVTQCRLQTLAQPPCPYATCWPPHMGFPWWRCY